jgi:hypothetical protein
MTAALLLLLAILLGLGALLIEGGRIWAALRRLVPDPPPVEGEAAPRQEERSPEP